MTNKISHTLSKELTRKEERLRNKLIWKEKQHLDKKLAYKKSQHLSRKRACKAGQRLMAAGIGLGFLCMMYLLYVTAANRVALKVEASGAKAMTAAGMAAITEGRVIRSDDECVIVRYYHEWDGTDYKWVSAYAHADYPVNAKVPVVYCLGMGIGCCLVAGFYRKYILLLSIIALLLFVSGFIMNLRRKEIDKWQEERL